MVQPHASFLGTVSQLHIPLSCKVVIQNTGRCRGCSLTQEIPVKNCFLTLWKPLVVNCNFNTQLLQSNVCEEKEAEKGVMFSSFMSNLRETKRNLNFWGLVAVLSLVLWIFLQTILWNSDFQLQQMQNMRVELLPAQTSGNVSLFWYDSLVQRKAMSCCV